MLNLRMDVEKPCTFIILYLFVIYMGLTMYTQEQKSSNHLQSICVSDSSIQWVTLFEVGGSNFSTQRKWRFTYQYKDITIKIHLHNVGL